LALLAGGPPVLKLNFLLTMKGGCDMLFCYGCCWSCGWRWLCRRGSVGAVLVVHTLSNCHAHACALAHVGQIALYLWRRSYSLHNVGPLVNCVRSISRISRRQTMPPGAISIAGCSDGTREGFTNTTTFVHVPRALSYRAVRVTSCVSEPLLPLVLYNNCDELDRTASDCCHQLLLACSTFGHGSPSVR
jgi:hypothetical protein